MALRTGGGRDDGFRRGGYHAAARWMLDFDYAEKLPPDAKAWLGRFAREYYDGRRSGLQSLEQQRDSDRARRRNDYDVLTTESLKGTLEIDERLLGCETPEDEIVAAIDLRRERTELRVHRQRAKTRERVRRYRERKFLLSCVTPDTVARVAVDAMILTEVVGQDRLRLAVAAEVDPKTLGRYLQGKTVRPAIRRRIERAAVQLGFKLEGART